MQSLNQTIDDFLFYFVKFFFYSLNEKRTSCSIVFVWDYPLFRSKKPGHHEETFLKGIEEHQQSIRTIVENSESLTFKNIILG